MSTIGVIQSGSVIRENNIISGFIDKTSNNYAKIPVAFNPENNDFEVCVKFTTDNSISSSTNRTVFDSNGVLVEGYRGIYIGISTNGKLAVSYTNADDSGWFTSFYSANTIAVNTIYWIKTSRSNNILRAWYSEDGKNWISLLANNSADVSINFSFPTWIHTYLGGRYYVTGQYVYDVFLSGIDLSGCYFKVNNQLIWSGIISDPKLITRFNKNYLPESFLITNNENI